MARAREPSPGVAIERIVAPGGASGALIDTAKDEDLVVVGSRGRRGLGGVLLGSVSQHSVHYAPCPVVVVPTPR